MNVGISQSLFEEAKRHLVGGVNSPVRAFRAVGGEPFFVARAKGSKIYDLDGGAYIDFVMSWGAHLLGHCHPEILGSLLAAAESGTSFGAPTLAEVELAKLVKEAFPSVEKLRLVSSGTEAVMTAVRLARAVTGRKKIVKFSGSYHGHSDSLLVKAGSGGATFGIPDSKGVPEELAQLTINVAYNDLETVRCVLERERNEVACVLVEPVAANMGVVTPRPGFLEGLREISQRFGALLIFDEVVTGFRLAWGGAQEVFGVRADLTCLGKILGGGAPLAALGGPAMFMDRLAPLGDVYQAGTLSGNPLATACGLVMLSILKRRFVYDEIERKAEPFYSEIERLIDRDHYPVRLNRIGSLFTLFFTSEEVVDDYTAKKADTKRFAQFFQELLRQKIFFPPSQFEAAFLSDAHSEEDLEKTLNSIENALRIIF